MPSSKSGYDLIAPYYDDLAGLIFGNEIFDAQICFLKVVPTDGDVLILGGGSGWILAELFKLNPGCRVWYIDSSAKMIDLAIKKTKGKSNIIFICGTEVNIPAEIKFDAIITNFSLNTFLNELYSEKIRFISKCLKKKGVWLVSDFVETGKKRHQTLSFIMHLFFRWLTKHPNSRLINWEEIFNANLLNIKMEKSFYNGFIKTVIFQR